MRKYFPITISLFFLIIVIIFWDNLKFPYNENNLIIGEHYLNKFNPQNDTLRFILFITLPCLVYLISYLKFNNFTYSFKKKNNDFFLKKKNNERALNPLNFYFFFFIILISVEFCTIDFTRYLSLDTFHDSVFLTPPFNHLSNSGFFKSTLYDYGFTGNNLGLIFNYFFGFYTIGAVNFLKIVLIFFVKFILILISKKITNLLKYETFYKKIFFILFTFALLCLPSYYDFTSYFSPRSSLYLFFIFLLGSTLCSNKYLELKFFLIGFYSLGALLWWFDIGLYTNFLLFLLSVYLLMYSNKKYLTFLLLGVSLSWLIFFILIPSEEIKAFFYNLKFIISTTDYLLGIEYLKPFSNNSTRWTKALLIIYICCIVLINFNFSKKLNLNTNLKIFLNLLFISGMLIFKSALTRSDTSHLKYASGIYTIIFIFIILFFIFNFFEKNHKFKAFISKLKNDIKKKIVITLFFIFSVFFFTEIINSKNNNSFNNKVTNIMNVKSNITELIYMEDAYYLKGQNLLAYEKYKELSKNDQCLQFFSDDNFFPYFLKKPTCTKFYNTNQIISGFSEKEFILEFSNSLPDIILLESPAKILLKYENFPNVIKYIKQHYEFYQNYEGYIFYKKIKI